VQVYEDDIVFGGSSNSLVARFAEDMSMEFEMSMMGELHFFLGLQIKQSKEGTFVHQAKYTKDIDRVTPLHDDGEARYPVLGMSVLSFLSVSVDFASASGEANFQVLASHSRLRPSVLRVLFFGSSWFFRCGFCQVSVG
jgi:hypothetical protein